MIHPGDRLRAISARLCSARTMERLIDPVLTDLQTEYSEAHRRGQSWRRRWILAAGYVAFLKVIIVCGCEQSMRALRDWPDDERRVLGRTLALCSAAMLALTILITFGPMLQYAQRHPDRIGLLIYSLPQALPIAVPVGFTLGIFCGLGGRAVSRRLAGWVLAAAFACSVVSFATMAWMIPAAGQAWRLSLEESLGKQITLTHGPLELTLSELGRQIDSFTHAGRTRESRKFRHTYHMRLALPFATFALALFALSVMPRRAVGHWILGLATCGACLAYYFLLGAGEIVGHQGTLPAFAGAWLPNVVFAVASAALLMAGSYRSRAISVK